MTLAHVIHRHWRAVQRDLLQTPRMYTPCSRRDIFTRFTVDEMTSMVVAAHPNTSVYHAVNGGFTTTDHLLATLYEHQAGLAQLGGRIPRPGVTDTDTRPARPADFSDISRPVKQITFDVTTIDDFKARRAARVKGA